MNDIFCDILRKHLNSDVAFNEESLLVADLGLSSFSMFALIVELEDAFDKKTDFDQLIRVKTVGELYGLYVEMGEKSNG